MKYKHNASGMIQQISNQEVKSDKIFVLSKDGAEKLLISLI